MLTVKWIVTTYWADAESWQPKQKEYTFRDKEQAAMFADMCKRDGQNYSMRATQDNA